MNQPFLAVCTRLPALLVLCLLPCLWSLNHLSRLLLSDFLTSDVPGLSPWTFIRHPCLGALLQSHSFIKAPFRGWQILYCELQPGPLP